MARLGDSPLRSASVPSRSVTEERGGGSMGQTARSIVWGRKRWGRAALSASALVMLVGATAPSAMAGNKQDGPAAASAPDAGDVRVIVMSDTSADAGERVASHHGKTKGNLDVAGAVVADV